MSLLIKNATIVLEKEIAKNTNDILLEKGKIVKIAPSIKPDKHKVIDAKGLLVMPGLIDIRVHFREPGREDKETLETGARSAAKGGFTTVMCMPNTSPVIDHPMLVETIIRRAQDIGLVNIIPIGAITKAQKAVELTDMFELNKAGCVALSDDGKSVNDSQVMRLALQYAKMADLLLIEHCQDPLLTSGGVMNEGYNSTLLGIKGDAGIAETVIVARDIELAHYLDTRVHLAHMSLKRSVELIRFAKSQGIKVTAEVCPHHFTLTDEAVKTFDTSAKMNPPLRTAEDVEALKEGLKDGTIDCIATDHAPHAPETKTRPFPEAPFGVIGLESTVPVMVTTLLKSGFMPWSDLVDRMACAPARVLGLNKGTLALGADADVTLIDLDTEFVLNADAFHSKSRNCPFAGQRWFGKVATTIVGGKVFDFAS